MPFKSCHTLKKIAIPDKVSLEYLAFDNFEIAQWESIIIETENENANFNREQFGRYDSFDGNSKIYVKNDAMKKKLERTFRNSRVEPENIIVGLPNENE